MPVEQLRENAMAECQEIGCGRRHYARGWCGKHYQRERIAGRLSKTQPRSETERFWSRINRKAADGCWLWQGATNPSGYGVFGVSPTYNVLAHRYSWALSNGTIPQGDKVLHRCDVRRCVNPAHLFLGTQQDNMRDMCQKKRNAYGQRSGAAKLTDTLVVAIYNRLKSGLSIGQAAVGMPVTPATVYAIKKGQTWKHLGLEPL